MRFLPLISLALFLFFSGPSWANDCQNALSNKKLVLKELRVQKYAEESAALAGFLIQKGFSYVVGTGIIRSNPLNHKALEEKIGFLTSFNEKLAYLKEVADRQEPNGSLKLMTLLLLGAHDFAERLK